MSTRVNRRQMLRSTALAGVGIWLSRGAVAAAPRVAQREAEPGLRRLRRPRRGEPRRLEEREHRGPVRRGPAAGRPGLRAVPAGQAVHRLPQDARRDAAGDRRGGGQHAEPHPRPGQRDGDAAGQARVLREAADATRSTRPAWRPRWRPRRRWPRRWARRSTPEQNYRRAIELLEAGAIGPVREVDVWTTAAEGGGDRPKETPPVPPTLDWDLWLGPAPYRPYHPCYLPRQWHFWWDFGGGVLGNVGCHFMDLPFWALQAAASDDRRGRRAAGPSGDARRGR